jgi:hypothetical protein
VSERIDRLKYEETTRPSTREGIESDLFLTGPGEYLCARIADSLKAEDGPWRKLFGTSIDPYKRMDFSIRELPAMRVYIEHYRKEYESWYINGEVLIDLIWPAALRRNELEQIPATVASALMQQFRRPEWFSALCQVVPGLNELGKIVDVDKAMGFELAEDEVVPMTALTFNFRMNLAEWDEYLEADYRTKDDPFLRTLGDLSRIYTKIQGVTAGDE